MAAGLEMGANVCAGTLTGLVVPVMGAIMLEATKNCLLWDTPNSKVGLIGSAGATALTIMADTPAPFAIAFRTTSIAVGSFLSIETTLGRNAWTQDHTIHATRTIVVAEAVAFLIHPALGAVVGVALGYIWTPKQHAS